MHLRVDKTEARRLTVHRAPSQSPRRAPHRPSHRPPPVVSARNAAHRRRTGIFPPERRQSPASRRRRVTSQQQLDQTDGATDPNTDPPRRFDRTGLRQAAIAVLERNWTGVATLPSPAQYPHQWSWDSAFIAIGWAQIQPARARTQLTALFQGQWSDGRVPHIQLQPRGGRGRLLSRTAILEQRRQPTRSGTSHLRHRPTASTCPSSLAHPPDRPGITQDPAIPHPAVPEELVAWHQYLLRRRHLVGSSLVPIIHPWESGMDIRRRSTPPSLTPAASGRRCSSGATRQASMPPSARPTSTTSTTWDSRPNTVTSDTTTPSSPTIHSLLKTRCSTPSCLTANYACPASPPSSAMTPTHMRRQHTSSVPL